MRLHGFDTPLDVLSAVRFQLEVSRAQVLTGHYPKVVYNYDETTLFITKRTKNSASSELATKVTVIKD